MGNYLPSRKQEEDGETVEKAKLSYLDSFSGATSRTSYLEYYRLYRHRFPYLIEDYLGINMNYYIS